MSVERAVSVGRSLVAFAGSVCARCIAGSPPRRAGNFLLRRQKKVTKEEALNRTRAGRRHQRRAKTLCAVSGRRDPLRSRCCPCDEHHPSHHRAAQRAAARRAHEKTQIQRRSGDAILARRPPGRRPSDAVFPGEFGVQPTLGGVKVAPWRS